MRRLMTDCLMLTQPTWLPVMVQPRKLTVVLPLAKEDAYNTPPFPT